MGIDGVWDVFFGPYKYITQTVFKIKLSINIQGVTLEIGLDSILKISHTNQGQAKDTLETMSSKATPCKYPTAHFKIKLMSPIHNFCLF